MQTVGDLVREAKKGNRSAYDELVDLYYLKMFIFCRMMVRDHQLAEDLTQDAFFQAWQRIDQLVSPEAFGRWIRMTVYRLTINLVRKRKEIVVPSRIEDFNKHEDDPHEIVSKVEECEKITQIIDELREIDKEALRSFYWEGLTMEQTASKYNIPLGTAKRRLFTARQRMKELVTITPIALLGVTHMSESCNLPGEESK